MAVLKNAKWETFAQALAKGETADAAYIAAGYKANRGNAATLKANQSVEARVSEILGRAAARTEITVADITTRLLAIATRAEKSSDAPMLQAARASLMDAAKLNGLIIDKAELQADVAIRPTIIEFVAPDAGED